MSWLLRWKKQPKAESSEEEKGTEYDEYVFVDKRPQPTPAPYQPDENAPGYSTGDSSLYPVVPPVPEYSALSIDPTPNQKDAGPHYLNGVPFKLSKQLEIIQNNDFEIDRLRIAEILSFIERIENDEYDYSFTLEEGVVAEMNSIDDQ